MTRQISDTATNTTTIIICTVRVRTVAYRDATPTEPASKSPTQTYAPAVSHSALKHEPEKVFKNRKLKKFTDSSIHRNLSSTVIIANRQRRDENRVFLRRNDARRFGSVMSTGRVPILAER